MSFWEKIKQSLRNFMSGRNGADRLGLTLLWTGLILYILGTLIGAASGTFWMLLGSLLNLAGFACYVLCIYRMFSRNLTKRQAENRRFESACARSKTRPASGEEPLQEPQAIQVLPLPQLQGMAPSAPGQGRCDRHLQPLPHQLHPKILAGAVPLHPGLRACRARRGARGTCGLAGVLPPLGNGPRGSRVWQG